MIWDLHCHLAGAKGRTPHERMAHLMQCADRLRIDRLCIYMGMQFEYDPSPDSMRRQNDEVIEAISHWHHRVCGFVYLNPKHIDASLRELDRCVADGPMVGIKLWVAQRCDAGSLAAIVRRAMELQAVIFQHTWIKTGNRNLPGESTPADLAALADRFRDAVFVCGHTGGNWELGIRTIRNFPNVYADLAGGGPDQRRRRDGGPGTGRGSRPFRQRRRRAEFRVAVGQGDRSKNQRAGATENSRRESPADPDAGYEAQGDRGVRIDVNVSLSRWPFRRMYGDEPAELVAELKKHGVEQAWAGSLDALFHRDVAAVNERLALVCRDAGGKRLLPFGVVNPLSPDWEEDLRRCHELHAMAGIRLHPNYHGYRLSDPAFAKLLHAAAERRRIVQIVVAMEDERTQHPLVRVGPVDVAPLETLLPKCPGARVVILNGLGAVDRVVCQRLVSAGEVYFDVAMLEGIEGLGGASHDLSHERIVFGSHFPLFYYPSALLKLEESSLAAVERRAIEGGNANRLLSRP